MITLSKAQDIALAYLNQNITSGTELVLIHEETIEFPEGYIFSSNTKRYVIDGNIDYRISGISPILVDKNTGDVFDPYENQYIYPEDLIQMYRIKINKR